MIYVPTYDPYLVYGPWPYPAYPPYYYYPPGYLAVPFITFGFGWAVGYAIWGGCDWHHHHVYIHGKHYDEFNHTHDHEGEWHHDPVHRRGVAYRDPATQNRYMRLGPPNPQAREPFRGRAGGTPRSPGAFPSIGSGAGTRRESSRGNVSRGSASSWGYHGAPSRGTVRGGGGGRAGGGMPSGGGGHGGGRR